MKFDTPASTNPIDQLKVVGHALERIDGPFKTTGTAPYAHERHDLASAPAYGYILGAAIAKGRIVSMDLEQARAMPGVIAIVNADNAGKLGKGELNTAHLLGGPQIEHYHQAIAVVVAQTFEQARDAALRIQVQYAPAKGAYELAEAKRQAKEEKTFKGPGESAVGNFSEAYAAAPVQLDETYSTAHESHSMMEPHASIAAWEGDRLTLYTSTQMVAWAVSDLAQTLGMPPEKINVQSPFIGGGFGCKLFLRSDALMAALAARAARRPVKIALQRALVPNNTTHRSATIQRVRIGAERDGKITAIAHECCSGNLPGGHQEAGALQTRALYAGAHRMTSNRLARLDLAEANSMRAPGEAPGMAVLEIAMDEMAEKLGMDPIEFRIKNDTQVVPDNAGKSPANPPFSKRQLVQCLQLGAQKFGWDQRNARPAQVREGEWLIGMGVAAAFRDNLLVKSGARVRLNSEGMVTVETDMTDIGTGSYTILAQTAAEMMGLSLEKVRVQLGDSRFPVSSGSGGQFGGNNSASGVYAACVKLREALARKAGFKPDEARFEDGQIVSAASAIPLGRLAADGELVGEDSIEYGDLDQRYRQSTFGAHFVEVAVHAATGEIRVRRMLAVCACGRILNPKTARSQVIGAMTMGVGAALMEKLEVDTRVGFFANHDLAGYEVPVHADIPHQEVIFLDETDPISSPMKAKGVAELGICGVAAAVANAVYNASGVRVRDYPVTLDKLIGKMAVVHPLPF